MTVGDVLDRVEAAGPRERRELLDEARAAVGLAPTRTVEARRHFGMTNRALLGIPTRDESGRALQACAAEGCTGRPTGRIGNPIAVADRRWWCGKHRHLAAPDDHLPPDDLEPRLDPRTMGLRPSREEEARLVAEDQRRRDETRRRREGERAEQEAIANARERYFREADLPPIAGAPQRRPS
jgi:hypothetical protein